MGKINTKEFLVDRDHTGREVVVFPDTGKKYFIEYIEPRTKQSNKNWGDLDPATKKVTGSYGQKYKGAITEEESLITESNGFKKGEIHEGTGSPYGTIISLHNKWKKENGY